MKQQIIEKNVYIEAFGTFPALTQEGVYWNGFECPYFTKEVADKIMESVNKYGDTISMSYDKEEDAYIYFEEGHENERFPSMEVEGQKYYAIGAFSWTWTEDDV